MKITYIKTRYSIEPKDRVYVKGYVFLSFAKKMGKNFSNKYSQKLLDTAKKSTTDAIKTASKRTIQKTAEATDSPKDVSYSKKHLKKLPNEKNVELTAHKKRYISSEEGQQIIDELRLVPENY